MVLDVEHDPVCGDVHDDRERGHDRAGRRVDPVDGDHAEPAAERILLGDAGGVPRVTGTTEGVQRVGVGVGAHRVADAGRTHVVNGVDDDVGHVVDQPVQHLRLEDVHCRPEVADAVAGDRPGTVVGMGGGQDQPVGDVDAGAVQHPLGDGQGQLVEAADGVGLDQDTPVGAVEQRDGLGGQRRRGSRGWVGRSSRTASGRHAPRPARARSGCRPRRIRPRGRCSGRASAHRTARHRRAGAGTPRAGSRRGHAAAPLPRRRRAGRPAPRRGRCPTSIPTLNR